MTTDELREAVVAAARRWVHSDLSEWDVVSQNLIDAVDAYEGTQAASDTRDNSRSPELAGVLTE